jgi:hypothetical protein
VLIQRCALAVVTERGRRIVRPALSELDSDEQDFLRRHVEALRSATGVIDARGRARAGSSISELLEDALTCSDEEFVEHAGRLVDDLALAMHGVWNAPDCVLALLTTGLDKPTSTSVLKLDAEIEAAHLEETERGGIRIRVFQDLLPSPGDLQKGVSWPDPRFPRSELIVLDNVKMGSAAAYFQRAMGVEASPQAKETEKELLDEISKLPLDRMAEVLGVATEGGSAEDVVRRIREAVPEFDPRSPALGAGDGLAGPIRPGFAKTAVRTFSADGIEVKVRLDKLSDITSEPFGNRYRTVIISDSPLVQSD